MQYVIDIEAHERGNSLISINKTRGKKERDSLVQELSFWPRELTRSHLARLWETYDALISLSSTFELSLQVPMTARQRLVPLGICFAIAVGVTSYTFIPAFERQKEEIAA